MTPPTTRPVPSGPEPVGTTRNRSTLCVACAVASHKNCRGAPCTCECRKWNKHQEREPRRAARGPRAYGNLNHGSGKSGTAKDRNPDDGQ